MIRRKDFYAIGILMLVMVAGAGTFGFFGVRGLSVFVRDVAFTAIGLFSTIFAVMASARQITEEISRKTLYPLLARPITRWQLIFGKWAAAWVISSAAFLAFSVIGIALLTVFSVPVTAIFLQYLILKIIGLAWLCGLTIALSLYATPAAAITLSLIICFGSSACGRIVLLANADHPMSTFGLNVAYSLLPHYDYFDLGAKATYAWPMIPWWVIGALLAYSALHGAAMLLLGYVRFRSQPI